MKYIPPKYKEIAANDSNFKLPEWDFINMNLSVFGFDENELITIFGISKSELSNWKSGKRTIPIDKIAMLCSMFDITIDQYWDRDSSFDEYYRFEKLSHFRELDYWKNRSVEEVGYLFHELYSAMGTMDSFCRGYYDVNDKEGTPFDDFEYLKFCCSALDIDITFDYKNRKKTTVRMVSYKELCEIIEKLKLDWGEDAEYHFWAWPNDIYVNSMLLTENPAYLKRYIYDPYAACEILDAWTAIKEKNPSFDKDYKLAKVLLADGAYLDFHDKQDKDDTLKLCYKIFQHDIETQKHLYKSSEKKANNN